jgi:hypothetical protein
MKIRHSFTARVFAIIMAMAIVNQTIFPTIVYGLTSGPKSPEFGVFNPVASTDMVNLATGDFQYNIPVLEIPGPDGGGYALSLGYNSGINSEMEASWVGLGWTLNPGAINRDTRGIPDDYAGSRIAKYNKTRPNWSVSATKMVKVMETFGVDASLAGSSSLRFNNYKGYHRGFGMGLSMRGLGLNIHLNDGTGVTYSPEINIFQNLNAKLDKLTSFMLSSGESKMLGKIKLIQLNRDAYIKSNSFGFYLFNEYDHSTSFSRYNGHSWNYSDAVRTSFTWFPIGFQKGTSANFNYQFNDYYYENNGYGFYYSGKAFGKANVLMDYFVEKEGSYNVRDIFIGMPFSNYDNFNVTGEGALGGFKAIQRKIGHFRANGGKNKTFIGSLGLELGVGENIGLGLDIGIGRQKTTLEDWGEIVGYGEDCHFRFHNDMGGQVDYHYGNTKPIQTNIFYKIFNIKIPIPNGIVDKKILDEVPQNNPRAAYIQEWTKKEMANDEEFIENLPDGVPEDALVKFSVTNESGVTYTYGQPVFIRNETSLSVDVDNMYKQIQGNYLSFRQLPLVMYDEMKQG